MKRLVIVALAGVTALGAVAHAADDSSKGKKREKGTLQAERAGWLMGMYIGEEKNNFYPFVIQVDKKSEAYDKGVREGDEIIRFDGEETSPASRLFNRANNIYPGHLVVMWVRRGVDTYHFELAVPKDLRLSPEERAAKEEAKAKKSKKADKKEAGADDSADGKQGKKKDKNKGPIVIKPIPAPDSN